MPDSLRVQDNERIERDDFEHISDRLPQEIGRMVPAQLLTNPAGVQNWVLSGFGMSNPAAKQLRVERGVAIMSMRERGAVTPGVVAFEGPAFIVLDLAAFAEDTYQVWVRAELQDAQSQNRLFWDQVDEEEYPQSIPTRRRASWRVRVAALAPGPEWMHIGAVIVNAGDITVGTGRVFYFEGSEDANYALRMSDDPLARRAWGGGDDRDPDRAAHGVHDFQTFAAAVLTKLQEIQSATARWWEAPAEALDRKVSRDGDLTLVGDYEIDGNLNVTTYLTVGPLLQVAGEGIFGGQVETENRLFVHIDSASMPDPSGETGEILMRNASNATDSQDTATAGLTMAWRMGSVMEERDGFDLNVWRTADDNPAMRLRAVVDAEYPGSSIIYTALKGSFTVHQPFRTLDFASVEGSLDVNTNGVADAAIPPFSVKNMFAGNGSLLDLFGSDAADGSRVVSTSSDEAAGKDGAIAVRVNGVRKWIRFYAAHN